MNLLNQPLLIDANLTRDAADEWYFKAIFVVAKLNKYFKIVSPGKSFTLSGISGTKELRIFSLQSSILE